MCIGIFGVPVDAIIGGKPASGLSADIVVNINGHCAGVFLDQNHVLTVASCLVNKTFVGRTNTETRAGCHSPPLLACAMVCKSLWQHFDRKKKSCCIHVTREEVGSHDIAVIGSTRRFSFNHNLTLNLDGWNSSTIFPILDDKFDPSIVQDTFVKFQGWGDISYDPQTGHPVKASGLYETDIEFVNTSFCKAAFVDQHNTSRYHTFLDFDIPRKFCVGTGETNAPFGCGEQGSGSGDEGGPLFQLPYPPTSAASPSTVSSRPTLLGLFSSMTPVIQMEMYLGGGAMLLVGAVSSRE